jgi:hypothetical protein
MGTRRTTRKEFGRPRAHCAKRDGCDPISARVPSDRSPPFLLPRRRTAPPRTRPAPSPPAEGTTPPVAGSTPPSRPHRLPTQSMGRPNRPSASPRDRGRLSSVASSRRPRRTAADSAAMDRGRHGRRTRPTVNGGCVALGASGAGMLLLPGAAEFASVCVGGRAGRGPGGVGVGGRRIGGGRVVGGGRIGVGRAVGGGRVGVGRTARGTHAVPGGADGRRGMATRTAAGTAATDRGRHGRRTRPTVDGGFVALGASGVGCCR